MTGSKSGEGFDSRLTVPTLHDTDEDEVLQAVNEIVRRKFIAELNQYSISVSRAVYKRRMAFRARLTKVGLQATKIRKKQARRQQDAYFFVCSS